MRHKAQPLTWAFGTYFARSQYVIRQVGQEDANCLLEQGNWSLLAERPHSFLTQIGKKVTRKVQNLL